MIGVLFGFSAAINPYYTLCPSANFDASLKIVFPAGTRREAPTFFSRELKASGQYTDKCNCMSFLGEMHRELWFQASEYRYTLMEIDIAGLPEQALQDGTPNSRCSLTKVYYILKATSSLELEVIGLLQIEDLSVDIGGKQVLSRVNLRIGPGETHALFGPNGTGKTTLLNAIAGIPRYTVTGGRIVFKGQDITGMTMDERARLGIGMAFQRPPALRGLKLNDLIKIINPHADAAAILKRMDFEDFASRDVNRGFSGGEIKRSEMVQLLAQQPDLVMLDEPDSGVDLENIKLIGEAINQLTQKDVRPSLRTKSGIIITHFGHILDYMKADRAHVMLEGSIVCSGNPAEILEQIKKSGYEGCVACLCPT
jgi:Fe-S cluster assembly ATP-binding protein